ncbi:TetR/AcrR family transcriptional regulator [Enemella sp. A6]|uniref:TetR/AcrR family transcriptional regulator n=1 Tax=Enemella sp. A6 TaxID=3440152 RepID=UPI003EB7C173
MGRVDSKSQRERSSGYSGNGRGRGRPRAFDRTGALVRAMEVFWEHGYEGTALSDLTAAMGIGPTSLYAAFGSKEGLFREAVAYYSAPQRSPIERALAEQATARGVVEAILRANVELYTRDDTPRGCLVVLSGFTYTEENAAVRDLLADLRRADRLKLRSRFEEAVVAGELDVDADPEALANFVVTVLHGLSVHARDGGSRDQLARTTDLAMAAWDHLTAQRPL